MDEPKIVHITKSQFAFDKKKLAKLNDTIRIHRTLSVGLITGATGCNRIDAIYILLLMFEQNLGDNYLLIYHRNYPQNAALRIPFENGLPETPFSLSIPQLHDSLVVNHLSEIFITIELDIQDFIEVTVEMPNG